MFLTHVFKRVMCCFWSKIGTTGTRFVKNWDKLVSHQIFVGTWDKEPETGTVHIK